MIWPNRTGRTWQYHDVFGAAFSQTGGSETATQTDDLFILYGLPYVLNVSGVHIYIRITFDAGTGLYAWRVDYDFPATWDAVHSGTLASGSGNPQIEVLCEVANHALTLSPACTGVHSFDSWNFQISLDGGLFTIYKTIGAVSEALSGLDKRFMFDEVDTQITDSEPVPSGPPNCAAIPALELQVNYSYVASSEHGWRYKADDGVTWLYDDVHPDNTLRSGLPCICKEDPPHVTENPASWNIRQHTSLSYVREITSTSSGSAHCVSPDFTGDYSYTLWHLQEIFGNDATNRFEAVPSSFGIPITRRQTSAHCNAASSASDVTTTDALTTCAMVVTSLKTVGHRDCITNVPTGCPSPVVLTSDFCSYDETDTITWPTAPPCLPGDKCLSYDVSFGGRHALAWIRSGTMWSAYSDNAGASWPETDSGISATCVCVRYDRQNAASPLYAWVATPGGDIVRYSSPDEGKTWGMPHTISSGTGNRTPTDVIGFNGVFFQYWVKPNGGGFDVAGTIWDRADNVVVAEFVAVAGVDDAGIAVGEFTTALGARKLRLWVIQGGVKVAYLSDEGKNFS